MIQVCLFLALGLFILFLSGKFLVDSSVALARRLRIPTMIIGLTVVAFGTSAPELLVSLQAAINGYPEIAMGNVVGSNISNILLVLAITAIIYPIPVPPTSVRRDWPVLMAVSLLMFLFCLDGSITRVEGGILVGLLALYITYAVVQAKRRSGETEKQHMGTGIPGREIRRMKVGTTIGLFAVSCAGLAEGAHLLVENAVVIAGWLGISQRVISITMVAVGTSVPELATSVIAAMKKETELSVGNIIGSNIMNILTVLGFTGIISGIPVERTIARFDIPWMLGVTLLLFFMMVPAARSRITRREGIFMVLIYLLYIYLIF